MTHTQHNSTALSRLWVGILLLSPALAEAHSFFQPVQLPMPYTMYIYGSMAALVLSFVIAVLFIREPRAAEHEDSKQTKTLPRLERAGSLLHMGLVLKCVLLFALLLSISTGLLGNRDPYRNFSMTYFWIVFALGGLYLSGMFGGWYAAANPWLNLARTGGQNLLQGRWRYPKSWGWWPACLLYYAFIWLELFGHTRPFSIAVLLLAYSIITVAGIAAFGARDWLRHAELFSVMFGIMSKMAPVYYAPNAPVGKRLRWRWPFAGFIGQRIEHPSLLVFILFMLSSTAFDGLSDTKAWFSIFWMDRWGVVETVIGEPPIKAYPWLRSWYLAYESLWLALSPFLYLLAFQLALWTGRLLISSPLSIKELSTRFGYTLVPIALVYHVTHYYTLVLNQGVKIRGIVSDPFGWGWNLFGNAISGRLPILMPMETIWTSQVWLILLGHVVSVWLAHAEAMRVFSNRRQALLSQLPMLTLMVGFTAAGLWILAQPLQGG